MKIFQENKKMKKSSYKTYNFSLPAVSTCPGAGACKQFCFAALEQLCYPSADAYRKRMFELSQNDSFVNVINTELLRLSKRGPIAIRIHASGDFYSPEYFLKWTSIARTNPSIVFYAYTKSIAMIKRLAKTNQIPSNFIVIFSLGSNQDRLVDVNVDRHSRIFANPADALSAGYTLASEDDAQAWSSPNNKIGLVMFGARKKKGNQVLNNINNAA